jgi:hypothetical protein
MATEQAPVGAEVGELWEVDPASEPGREAPGPAACCALAEPERAAALERGRKLGADIDDLARTLGVTALEIEEHEAGHPGAEAIAGDVERVRLASAQLEELRARRQELVLDAPDGEELREVETSIRQLETEIERGELRARERERRARHADQAQREAEVESLRSRIAALESENRRDEPEVVRLAGELEATIGRIVGRAIAQADAGRRLTQLGREQVSRQLLDGEDWRSRRRWTEARLAVFVRAMLYRAFATQRGHYFDDSSTRSLAARLFEIEGELRMKEGAAEFRARVKPEEERS